MFVQEEYHIQKLDADIIRAEMSNLEEALCSFVHLKSMNAILVMFSL